MSENRQNSFCGTAGAAVLGLAALGLASCQGVLGGMGSGDGGTEIAGESGNGPLGKNVEQLCAETGDTLRVGRTLLRRMTRQQFDNTVRDLLNVTGRPSAALSPDARIGPFFSNSNTPVTNLLVQQHGEVAEALAAQAESRMNEIAGCDLSAGDDSCAAQFVDDFGLRAYRRPLESDEREGYLSLFRMGRDQVDAETGFRMVLETMLQAPSFLYHADVGMDATPSSEPVPLSSYGLASRLSYFLWNTLPDARLFELAETGELQDPEVLEAEVARMLDDPRAADAIPEFHLQWLGVGDPEGVQRSPEYYPDFDPELARAMHSELVRFTDHLVRRGDGLMSTLFTANYSFLEGPLFDLYGVEEPPNHVVEDPVPLDPAQRSGILTQAAVLTAHSHAEQTSPVHRGILIRENLLCQPISPPPPEVNDTPPSPTPDTSTRDRFAAHSTNPQCAGCHVLMDPIGLGFENYDAIGAYRTVDGNQEVDATGELTSVSDDLAGPFTGAIELSERLGNSEDVAYCLANQWFRFALSRIESNDDACALESIYRGFEQTGNIRDLLSAIVLSDAFRYVRTSSGEE